MHISATVMHHAGQHQAQVQTRDRQQSLNIPANTQGPGSGINGGELLFLALATCYCNDIYREAAELGLEVASVQVNVTGRFSGKGQPAEEIRYRVTIRSSESREQILALLRHTDAIAEVHNTLRRGTAVTLEESTILEAPSPRQAPLP